MRRVAALAIVGFLTLHGAALGQQGAPAPGEYITERGWGVLKIEPAAKGALAFSIEAVGGNLFVCGLDGEIRNGRADLEGTGGKRCIVRFVRKGEDIDVQADSSICNYHCGAHASFPGLYLKVAPACTVGALKKTREAFKVQYDRKDFAAARAVLEPVVKDCARTLDRFEGGWIRNDLAITKYRLGDRAGCTQTLAPLSKDAGKSDQHIRNDYGQMDAEKYVPVIKATRTNLKLCSGDRAKTMTR